MWIIIDIQRTYLYSWLNHGQRITPKPNPRRVVGSQKVGQVSVEEIQVRDMIRARTIPGSVGPDPDVYNIKFMPGRMVKFRRSKTDAWNSWFEYMSETEVRQKFWYPNIKAGDVVVDAGAVGDPTPLPQGSLEPKHGLMSHIPYISVIWPKM